MRVSYDQGFWLGFDDKPASETDRVLIQRKREHPVELSAHGFDPQHRKPESIIVASRGRDLLQDLLP